jgi:hypothetical protein
MKKLLGIEIEGEYAFNAASKTITFSGVSQSLTLANILLITNVTDNVIIYNFADSAKGATSFSSNILTLTYDTTSMSNTDVLQIYLDVESYEESLHTLLRRMNKLLESNAVVDSSLRQRVAVEAMPTVAVTLASAPTTAVTNTTGFGAAYTINTPTSPYTLVSSNVLAIYEGPVDQRWRIIDSARAAYGSAIRPNLIFS